MKTAFFWREGVQFLTLVREIAFSFGPVLLPVVLMGLVISVK